MDLPQSSRQLSRGSSRVWIGRNGDDVQFDDVPFVALLGKNMEGLRVRDSITACDTMVSNVDVHHCPAYRLRSTH